MKKAFIYSLIVVVVIQFFRPAKNSSSTLSGNDITRHYPVADSVLGVLKRSCYDCHSNNTVYPWYDRLQPIAWWLQYHVNHGKHALNFSEFGTYTVTRKLHVLKGISEEVKQDGMPLDSYLWIHKNAILDSAEKSLLIHWADSLRGAMLRIPQ